MDLKLGMLARHFGKNRSEMDRTRCERNCYAEPSTKITFRQDRLARDVDFSTDFCRVVAKQGTSLRQAGSPCRSCKQLDPKRSFDSGQATTDHRLRNAQSSRSRRDPSRVGDLHEYPQIFDVHLAFLRHDTIFRAPIVPL